MFSVNSLQIPQNTILIHKIIKTHYKSPLINVLKPFMGRKANIMTKMIILVILTVIFFALVIIDGKIKMKRKEDTEQKENFQKQ